MATGANTAPNLLVIDLQQGLVDGDPSWGPRSTPDLIHNVALILDFWRGQAWPVVHVHHDDADPANPLRRDRPETFKAHACSAPLLGEPIFHKAVGSAFVGTKLEQELRQKGGKELYIIGMDSTQCITNNTRHAVDLGFNVVVVEDACACYAMQDYKDASKIFSAEETQHTSMNMLANAEAKVISTADLLKSFREG